MFCARLHRDPVQDGRHADRPRARCGPCAPSGPASRRLCGRGCERWPIAGSARRPAFAPSRLVAMQRPVETPTGPDIAAFTLARIMPGQMPEGRIQMLDPSAPSTPCVAAALAGPSERRARARGAHHRGRGRRRGGGAVLRRFTGRPAAACEGGRVVAQLDRGRVELVTADAFRGRFPEIAIPSLPFMGACTRSRLHRSPPPRQHATERRHLASPRGRPTHRAFPGRTRDRDVDVRTRPIWLTRDPCGGIRRDERATGSRSPGRIEAASRSAACHDSCRDKMLLPLEDEMGTGSPRVRDSAAQ